MSWKKFFRSSTTQVLPISDLNYPVSNGNSAAKYASYLPEVYAGHPNRIQRYYQYDDMDRDSDINAALDTIADFCTQSEEQSDEPFEVAYLSKATETEVKLLKEYLEKWIKIQNFRSRLWNVFKHTIKYGDMFFLRDPETMEWMWVDPFMVEMIKMDEAEGKVPTEYIIRGLTLSKQGKFATVTADPSQYRSTMGTSNGYAGRPSVSPSAGGPAAFSLAGSGTDPRQKNGMLNPNNQLYVVDAKHVVHLSLSVAMDINFPFGQSILEPIFKVYKQKELLEDAAIIYRVQRAPERRVFSIDVGQMPLVKQKQYLEQFKQEIHSRRIPNRTGGGSSIMDAAYNPMSMIEDYFLAVSSEGRGSKIDVLPGGQSTGEIEDLSWFSKKLARGLRVPASYLSIGDDSQSVSYNDGKLGAALIQEYRFNKYCMRLQNLLSGTFDREFKYYLEKNGIEIDSSIFELRFNPPQNFTKYRQIEIDAQQMQVYQAIQDNKKLSERFKLKRFLNLSEAEILESEELWKEENPDYIEKQTGQNPIDSAPQADLSDAGIRGVDDGGFGSDMNPNSGMGDFSQSLNNTPENPSSETEGTPPPEAP